MDSASLSALLITAGTILMVFNLILFFFLAKEMLKLQSVSHKVIHAILLIYGSLITFFLLGYAVIDVTFHLPSFQPSYPLVGCIFLFGSIFVLIVTLIQLSLSRAVKKSSLDMTRALICSVEARDANLNGHSLHVARLTTLLYGYLPKQLQQSISAENLEYAALLHDIGKLGIPESILNKESPLTDSEWEEIKKHPVIGKQLVSALPYSPEIADWILCHHERYDGKGYLGLSGSQIPLASQIIAVADTYSAITMPRAYHPARSCHQATQIIRECSGTQFHPEIAACFLSIPEDEILSCMPDQEASSSYHKFDLSHPGQLAGSPMPGTDKK